MDSGRTEDLLQQNITQIQGLHEELRTGREQQDQNGASTTNSSIPADISRVAVQLPPFWAERPAVWFAQVEAQSALAGISSEKTKFYYVISQLDHRYAAEVEDIITSPPERDPYTTLKAELVPLERATHPSVPYTRDGRPQAVPVSQTTQDPRPTRARRLPPQHLVQPATAQHKGIVAD
jgi:hypothetical protein